MVAQGCSGVALPHAPWDSGGFGVLCESAGYGDVTGLSGFLDLASTCLDTEEVAFQAPITLSPPTSSSESLNHIKMLTWIPNLGY